MKQSIKENIVLIAGVALPLLVGLVFYVSTKISVMGIAPPQTSVVYASGLNDYNGNPWDVTVRDGKLYAVYVPVKDNIGGRAPVIYRFDPVTKNVQTFRVPPLEKDDLKKRAEFEVTGLGDITLLKDEVSPDGFTFSRMDRGNGSFMSEIFGGRGRAGFVLKKNAYKVPVPETSNAYDIEFVGWDAP